MISVQQTRALTHSSTALRRMRLRIGLVHDDRLLTEQAFDPAQTVTIGASARDTLALPDVDYQGAALVFAPDGAGGCTVSAPADAQPRLAVQDAVLDEAAARRQGVVTARDGFLQFKVGRDHRGRCQLGPYTVLFQVIEQTVDVPVLPKLSVAQRLRRAAISEPAWKASLALSAGLLLSVVAQAEVWNRSTGRFLRAVPEELVQAVWLPEPERLHLVPVAEIEPPPLEPAPADPAPATASPAAKHPAASKPNKERGKAEPTSREGPQALVQTDPARRIERDTIAGTFRPTSKIYQPEDEAAAEQVAHSHFRPATDADPTAQPGAERVQVRKDSKHTATRVDKANVTVADRDQRDTADQGAARHETQVIVRTTPPVGPDEGKTDVAKALRGKANAVQRCYEQELRANPGAAGKVTVTFTVGTEGTVTDSAVAGASGGFAECIQGVFARLRGLPLLHAAVTFSQSYVFSKAQ
ncbi:MAG: AgmX/PglI C-terminal domain-containing protein [Deltaproteobacteria bacterium]|nr:AgmX/PglI C-terminal domain-containing protein [Deltaproteobacteria bacterium]